MTVSTLCPYCAHDLKALLSRRRKCPSCRQLIHYKKPFPYTMADEYVPKILMTDEQAAARLAEWDSRPTRMPSPDQPGPDGRLPDGRMAKPVFYARELQRLRESHADIVAIEIVESPAKRCDHIVRRLWLLDDPPPMPPANCLNDPCVCWVQGVFADELNQREVFGWTLFDSDGRFTPVHIEIKEKPPARPETPEDKILKEAFLKGMNFTITRRTTTALEREAERQARQAIATPPNKPSLFEQVLGWLGR